MKFARTIGAWLIAVFAIGAVAAATASASAPEAGRCVAQAGGKYSDEGCTKKVLTGGKFEWFPGAVKGKFKTTGGVGALETLNGTTVGCSTEESGGEYLSPKSVTGVVVRFTGCHSVGFICSTEGSASGEIVTNPLEGKVGFISKAKKQVALDLFPTAADKGLYVKFVCPPSLSVSVGGSVLVPATPVDKMLSSFTLNYTATKGKQKPVAFEESTTNAFEATPKEKSKILKEVTSYVGIHAPSVAPTEIVGKGIPVGTTVAKVSKTEEEKHELTMSKPAKEGANTKESMKAVELTVLMTTINAKAPEQSGITISSTITGEEALELNAVV